MSDGVRWMRSFAGACLIYGIGLNALMFTGHWELTMTHILAISPLFFIAGQLQNAATRLETREREKAANEKPTSETSAP
jgi:ABC-type multidrug transport system fused ATPase/permease subunit